MHQHIGCWIRCLHLKALCTRSADGFLSALLVGHLEVLLMVQTDAMESCFQAT